MRTSENGALEEDCSGVAAEKQPGGEDDGTREGRSAGRGAAPILGSKFVSSVFDSHAALSTPGGFVIGEMPRTIATDVRP